MLQTADAFRDRDCLVPILIAHRLHPRDFLCFASAGIWVSDEHMIETEVGYKTAKSLLSLRERRVSAIVPGPVCPTPGSRLGSS